ncbi:DUF3618 domain-containing protein [Dactylosporangium sp. McL0621]|uniref:DUF3618 domain-containing protein n=1 Tax=Dactylosporangium sp. McL0621 TaxID=3415678 RepID=UPI003CEA9EED
MTADGRVNDPEALRAEIVRTRAALGETVEALAAKADVKARTRAAIGVTADAMTARTRAALGAMADALLPARRTRLVLAAGVTMVVGAVAVLALRGRRR